ncbi:fatty acid hydroxylase [Epithele typhae]|uniref:fatty acid hydroxylase n=1 Tax=Epithele typhae TaxID=378194 RepID=UPI002007D994|nr:fatty acid hydroxylase [Epithele typhae]KAH9937812.1 fatty acid hydroxylase [Epithele typhae]
MTTPIPQPPGVPFLGNVNTIDRDLPIKSFELLTQQYGEIFQLNIFGARRIIINSYKLQAEMSDEKRFIKNISANLKQVRAAASDGLFTAFPDEPNWGKAHRLLMPCFGTAAIFGMYDGMMDIIDQLVTKWERFGPHEDIDPAADFTRLTLDAIALCSMSYRLNSFYREEPHPFAIAMTDFLLESGRRSARNALVQAIMTQTNAKYEADIATMGQLVSSILEDHKIRPPAKPDLVTVMLNGVDKETREKLPEENIRANLLTFLIAGHETTSGMLTFVVYYLLKNPEAMRKLRDEIDTKIGGRRVTTKDVNQLPYLLAVMREAMRLGPTAPARSVTPIHDDAVVTGNNGQYLLHKDEPCILVTFNVHRDPKVWGDDVLEFKPERMLDGKFEALPPNAWQPFGFGLRGCIGRPFAWQEAQLALISIFQRFDLVMRDPTYELEIKQTLTIKPHNFYVRAIPRTDRPRMLLNPSSAPIAAPGEPAQIASDVSPANGLKPMYVFYGSNTGNSESFAQRIVSAAPTHGFAATLSTLDMAAEHLPKDGPVLILTASFEGLPADNAKHFVEWAENVKAADAFAGIKYGVFGCGNTDWVSTYQRVPKLIDDALEARGAIRLVDRGVGDAASAEFFDAFDKWEEMVWAKLSTEYGAVKSEQAVGLEIKTVSSSVVRAELLRQRDMGFGTVIENKVLTAEGHPPKMHIELALPEGFTYRAGDYLAILPTNPERTVRRAMARLNLDSDAEIEISSTAPTHFPTGKPVSVFNLLSGYVELQQPATQRDLEALIAAAPETAQAALKDLVANYADKVFAPRLSVLDVLEEQPSIPLTLGPLLHMLPAMRIRQYSISSSPLWNPTHATLTLAVVDAPARSGRTEPYLGVASTYLASLRGGDKVQCAVRPSAAAFHPPTDPGVPLVMICAGSGLAPMRGFLQERAEQKRAGRAVAASLLFFGCRDPRGDFLYGDAELKEWAELGVVDVRPAFSRCVGESAGCRYVHDRIGHDKAEVVAAYDAGAKFFVCGSGRILQGVKETIVELVKEVRGISDEVEAQKLLNHIMQGRFATDIFE